MSSITSPKPVEMTRLVGARFSAATLAFFLWETALLAGCYLAAVSLTQAAEPLDLYLLYDGGLTQIAFVVAVIQAGLYFQLLYEIPVPRSRLLLLQQFCKVLGIAFLVQALCGYANWMLQLPKWTMIYGSLFALMVLPAWRLAYAAVASRAIPVRRLLLVGGSDVGSEIAAYFKKNANQGVEVIGYLSSDSELPLIPKLGRVEDLEEVILERRPNRVVTALAESGQRIPTRQLLNLQMSGIQIEEASVLFETLAGRIRACDLQPSELIFSSTFDPRTTDEASGRLYSVLLGTLAMIVAMPVFTVVALLIGASSRGPVFLRQKRMGLGGVPFHVYRFRSTQADETSQGSSLTWVGRWLRRLRLEGLPQLFNVVRGEMTVVGPRAERVEYAAILEQQIPFYRQRYCVRPGLTGWAQVNFKGQSDIPDAIAALEYDLYYIKNMSAAMDAYILLHSLPGTS